jgi:hypothetical protein
MENIILFVAGAFIGLAWLSYESKSIEAVRKTAILSCLSASLMLVLIHRLVK